MVEAKMPPATPSLVNGRNTPLPPSLPGELVREDQPQGAERKENKAPGEWVEQRRQEVEEWWSKLTEKWSKPGGKKGQAKEEEPIRFYPVAVELRSYWWARRIMAWLDAMVGVLLVAALLSWGSLLVAVRTPSWEVTVENSVASQVREMGRKGMVDRDAIMLFCATVLPLLHGQDYQEGGTLRGLLAGMISTRVLDRVRTHYAGQRSAWQQAQLVQTLVVTRVSDVAYSEETDRYTAVVRGYLHVSGQVPSQREVGSLSVFGAGGVNMEPEVTIIPYRAEVVLRRMPWNMLAPMGLFLEELREQIDPPAAGGATEATGGP